VVKKEEGILENKNVSFFFFFFPLFSFSDSTPLPPFLPYGLIEICINADITGCWPYS
jgi:hypothetical protein